MRKFILLIPIIIFVLTSCDKYSDYQNIIDNRSSDTIFIYFQGTTAYVSGTDSIIALPKTKTIYYDGTGSLIKTKNHNCDPQIAKNETTIISSSGRQLKKDISNKDNWACETNKNNSFWKMTFQINEDDLNEQLGHNISYPSSSAAVVF